jgi:hypothetical protein
MPLKNAHLLCCTAALRRCGVLEYMPHSEGLVRRASGTFLNGIYLKVGFSTGKGNYFHGL